MRTLTATLLLLALSDAAAMAQDAYADPENPQHWNLQVEAVAAKVMPTYNRSLAVGAQAELLRLRLSYDRFSVGVTAARLTGAYVSVPTFHAGYTFYHGSFRSMRPEAYVELEAITPGVSVDGGYSDWTGRLAACCDIDYYFVGATSEIGALVYGARVIPEASIGLRLVTNFGF